MSVDSIRACLDKRLQTLPSAPDLSFENVTYVHTVGVPFIKATLVPNSIRPATRGNDPWLRYDGIYAVNIYTPEGQGSGAGYTLADDVLEHFKATNYITDGAFSLTVDYAEVGTSFLDSPFYCTPVNVVWYTYIK